MRNKMLYKIAAIVFIVGFAVPVLASMDSENYGIADSVFSNGGGPMTSESFGIDATLGQPSPLMEYVQPASASYAHLPGFWYPLGEITLIHLATFSASPGAQEVILAWSTESEIDNAGFNIYRADSENGAYTKINASIIAAQGYSTLGGYYEFVDTGVKNRTTYYYKLEDIDLNGVSTLHGPISATPRFIFGLGK
jgi:hypothetical protein